MGSTSGSRGPSDLRERTRIAVDSFDRNPLSKPEDQIPKQSQITTQNPTTEKNPKTRMRSSYSGERRVLFSVSNLVKSYGKTTILSDVSMECCSGQIVGLIGKNGAGKSTLVESALGLKPFDSGKVTIGGIDAVENPKKAKKLLGYSPSEPLAYDSMTGAEYISYVAAIYGMDPEVARDRAETLREALALPSAMLNKPFSLCSHGTQQKVCLAASVIHEPLVWILDEPTVGLDIIAYRALLKLMRSYADKGNCVLIVTHDMELVQSVCDSIYLLKGEKLYSVDPDSEDIEGILEGER